MGVMEGRGLLAEEDDDCHCVVEGWDFAGVEDAVEGLSEERKFEDLGCRVTAVAADFVLSLPVTLVEDLDCLLEFREVIWPTETSDFVFKPIRKSLVVLSNKGDVVPTSA
jgi:hypothetical protein